MMDVLTLFGPSTLMAVMISIPLTLSGPHLCARGQYLELLPLAQLAHFLIHLISLLTHGSPIPPLPLFFAQIGISLVAMKFARRIIGGNELKILASYLILMTTDHALLTLFPNIDGHLSSHLFGDIVTIGGTLGISSALMALFLTLFLAIKQREYLKETIEYCLFSKKPQPLFEWLGLLSLSLCLYNLGPVHTLSILILPSLFLTRQVRGHLTMILFSVVSLTLSCSLGMFTSSFIERVPSVTVVTLTFVLCLLIFGGLPGKKVRGKI